ncbi:sugar transferase [Facklamia sp. P9177]|uniref:sugar transferase n=1 Tax=Facklamia sp. P9177 TaxID=3421945 RepID=UPI003D177F23
MQRYQSFYAKYVKRFLDIILSLMALIVFSPIIIITGILVRIKLGSPILFKQKRPGLNEEIFEMMKFRTMTDERDENGDLLPDSVRLTSFGKKLRATSLDELPELLNILKGDMSIVGPRPLLERYLSFYSDEEKQRHIVRPGLTGLAQVKGRNYLPWNERLNYDIEYINKISFLFDIKILIFTVVKVLKKEDIATDTQDVLKSLDVERGSSNEIL